MTSPFYEMNGITIQLKSYESVADNEGVYPNKMGGAACEEFYGKSTLW